jgi:hypothetical protein
MQGCLRACNIIRRWEVNGHSSTKGISFGGWKGESDAVTEDDGANGDVSLGEVGSREFAGGICKFTDSKETGESNAEGCIYVGLVDIHVIAAALKEDSDEDIPSDRKTYLMGALPMKAFDAPDDAVEMGVAEDASSGKSHVDVEAVEACDIGLDRLDLDQAIEAGNPVGDGYSHGGEGLGDTMKCAVHGVAAAGRTIGTASGGAEAPPEVSSGLSLETDVIVICKSDSRVLGSQGHPREPQAPRLPR